MFLIDVRPGSVIATLELPSLEASLFPELPGFGDPVLSDTQKDIEAVVLEDADSLERIVPEPDYRKRIPDSLIPAIPAESSDYTLQVRFEPSEQYRKLTRPSKETVLKLAGLPERPPGNWVPQRYWPKRNAS